MVWENLTQDLMKNRISPWIHKKLHEIIGEDEPTLVSFITEKLEAEEKPENILSEIRVVLG
jgi:RNA-binding protein 25